MNKGGFGVVYRVENVFEQYTIWILMLTMTTVSLYTTHKFTSFAFLLDGGRNGMGTMFKEIYVQCVMQT